MGKKILTIKYKNFSEFFSKGENIFYFSLVLSFFFIFYLLEQYFFFIHIFVLLIYFFYLLKNKIVCYEQKFSVNVGITGSKIFVQKVLLPYSAVDGLEYLNGRDLVINVNKFGTDIIKIVVLNEVNRIIIENISYEDFLAFQRVFEERKSIVPDF